MARIISVTSLGAVSGVPALNGGMSPVRYERHRMQQAKALEKNQIPCTKKG
jgi:hypothetical protein